MAFFKGTSRRRAEADVLEHGQRGLSCLVGGRATTAAPGGTDKGFGIPGSCSGGGRFRGEDDHQVSLHPVPWIHRLWRGTVAAVIAVGYRGLARYRGAAY